MNLRIRDLREDNDLSQKSVADYLMCDQSLYSKYERGEREIPLRLIIKLAEFSSLILSMFSLIALYIESCIDGTNIIGVS